jgi:hypothetical protein
MDAAVPSVPVELALRERERPQPGPGEALVRVDAAEFSATLHLSRLEWGRRSTRPLARCGWLRAVATALGIRPFALSMEIAPGLPAYVPPGAPPT